MEKITATRSLTVSSERQNLSFERCWDVSGTEFTIKGDSLEAGGARGEHRKTRPAKPTEAWMRVYKRFQNRKR